MAEALFEVRYDIWTRMIGIVFLTIFSTADPPADGVKKRKKRNRWGDAQENKAAGLMGLPTLIMANFTNEQLEAYTLHLRIEEISQKLRINDVVPADGDRFVYPVAYSLAHAVANRNAGLRRLLRSTITSADV